MNTSPGERLRAWREAQTPELKLTAAARELGVSHPFWSDIEAGKRSPGIETAIAIENLTAGAIPVELWGFDAATVEGMRELIARRDDPTGPVATHDEVAA